MENIIKVLVVDGSCFTRNFLENLLIQSGFVVRAVACEKLGMRELLNNNYDLAIVSYGMSEINGVQFKDIYKDFNKASNQTKFILTYGFDTQLISGDLNEFLAILPKPLNPNRVLAVVGNYKKMKVLN